MTELPNIPRDPHRYILKDYQPVICDDESTWRAFMNDGANLLVAQDTVGKFTVVTVFLGFNYGNIEQPRFFQTTCLGTDSENRPRYTATWEQAMLQHRGKVKCAQMLTNFAAEQAAGIDRSFRFVDCKVIPGELQFVLESEAEAIRALPEDQGDWQRRGRVLVFSFA
ncbi:hypothetical protein N836_14800 [Leptolyngbya sp. Heron Island J]|uniref:hypothetical protein n=1 Tax=Leptolyngbya sp. Heron Island J TaxID=1385935 RepID=UPI0003B9E7F9|nr:hypothetical protein [Leptolyngbya sp. Heron Island J]ESA35025.1 hypothetical protein N836_14800 [Leptolyngbya sp. Heron Island J]